MKIVKIPDLDMKEIRNIFSGFHTKRTEEDIFYNMCFVVCVPQTKYGTVLNAVNGLKSDDFFNRTTGDVNIKNRVSSVRFPNNKARYVKDLKERWIDIYAVIASNYPGEYKRKILVDMVNGLGMKTCSHFLRNMGEENLAIIDVHIINFMNVETPSNKKRYLEIESNFRDIAIKSGYSVAELDAYVWKTRSGVSWNDFIY